MSGDISTPSEANFKPETAEQYVKIRARLTSTDSQIFSLLNKLNLKNKDVLDLGCGDGRYALVIKSLGARTVAGVDNSQTMIDLAKTTSLTADIRFKLANAEQLPFDNDSFDLVFSYFVFHHIPNLKAAIKETSRVLKPGGHLLASQTTFDTDSDQPVSIKLGTDPDSVRVTVYPQKDEMIYKNLADSGFKIISYGEVSNPESQIDPDSSETSPLKKKTVIYLAVKN